MCLEVHTIPYFSEFFVYKIAEPITEGFWKHLSVPSLMQRHCPRELIELGIIPRGCARIHTSAWPQPVSPASTVLKVRARQQRLGIVLRESNEIRPTSDYPNPSD